MKGLPSGYNKDLQEDKEAVFDAEATLAVVAAGAAHAVVSRLSINAERTGRAASGLLLATDVADYLVSRGMPFRRAHEVVGAMVRRLLAEGRDFSDLTLGGVARGQRRCSATTRRGRPRRWPRCRRSARRSRPVPTAVRAALEECRGSGCDGERRLARANRGGSAFASRRGLCYTARTPSLTLFQRSHLQGHRP